jgi:putative transposase
MWKALQAKDIKVSKERVRNLMKAYGIQARGKRKFVVTTDSKHNLPIAPNLLQRNFTTAAPNQVWTGDITYIQTDEGWLYLAAVLDLFSRQVVGFSMQQHMRTSLVSDALRMAWFRRKPSKAQPLIFHSDRGSQYCSEAYQVELIRFNIQPSMSRKGDCWDNVPTESLCGSLKVGWLHGRRFATRREAMDEVID